MLTSFFAKSKPVNGILVAVFTVVFFISANFQTWFLDFQISVFFEKLMVLLVFVLSIYVLNFITRKNELTRRSAYKMVLFAAFSASFFSLLKDSQVILANFFVLLALRRIISLRSGKVMQKKIFDAAFWISIASLFYFWAILLIIVVYAGVFLYLPRFRNWLVPLVGFSAVAVLNVCFHLVAYEEVYDFVRWVERPELDFSNYGKPRLLLPLSLILALLLWTSGNFIKFIGRASISLRPSLNLVAISQIVAFAVALLAPTKNGSELIFLFVPLSIIATLYFERKKDRVFKDVLLAMLILLPFLTFFLP